MHVTLMNSFFSIKIYSGLKKEITEEVKKKSILIISHFLFHFRSNYCPIKLWNSLKYQKFIASLLNLLWINNYWFFVFFFWNFRENVIVYIFLCLVYQSDIYHVKIFNCEYITKTILKHKYYSMKIFDDDWLIEWFLSRLLYYSLLFVNAGKFYVLSCQLFFFLVGLSTVLSQIVMFIISKDKSF